MGANWLDLVILGIVALAVMAGFKRGFGRAIFDFAAILVAARIAYLAYTPLSEAINFSANEQANAGWSFGLLFVAVGIILWLIGKLAYDTTLISLDTFDPPLGAMLGIGIAIIACHMFASTVFMATEKDSKSDIVYQSAFAPEFHTFTTYRNAIDTMKRMGD